MSSRAKSVCIVAAALALCIALTSRSMLRNYRTAKLSPMELRVPASDTIGHPVPATDPSEAGRWGNSKQKINPIYASTGACRPKLVGDFPDVVWEEIQSGEGERYRNSPAVNFEIGEDGVVSNVKLVQSSGVKKLDKQVIEAASRLRYRPRPNCGVLESSLSVNFDF